MRRWQLRRVWRGGGGAARSAAHLEVLDHAGHGHAQRLRHLLVACRLVAVGLAAELCRGAVDAVQRLADVHGQAHNARVVWRAHT